MAVTYMLDYFVAPDQRNKEPIRLEDGSGIKISWSMKSSFGNFIMYTNWLTTLIKYANEIGIDVVKTAKLIHEGHLKKLGHYHDDIFLSIFLHSIRDDNDGKNINENILSHNSKILDK